MNNRQKAKHFKRLYEKILAQTVYSNKKIVYPTGQLDHYRSEVMMSSNDILALGDRLDEIVYTKLISDFDPILAPYITSRRDDLTDAMRFSLDIWLMKE